MKNFRHLPALVAVLMACGSLPVSAAAQPVSNASPDASSRLATRASLDSLVVVFDRLALSTAYSERARSRARAGAREARRRLTEGDFRVGDQIVLQVGGQVVLDDTVTVTDGPKINVRGIRQVSLAGVLRSELQLKLLTDLTEVVRNATVLAEPLMRVAVLGSVAQPGFKNVPGDATLDRVLTLAGGPAANAALDKTTIVRADTVLVSKEEVFRSFAEGRTVGMLAMRDGDAVMVPAAAAPWDRQATLGIIGLLMGPLMAIFVFRR